MAVGHLCLETSCATKFRAAYKVGLNLSALLDMHHAMESCHAVFLFYMRSAQHYVPNAIGNMLEVVTSEHSLKAGVFCRTFWAEVLELHPLLLWEGL